MDEDRFNMAVRKFLKEVGVTSQREIERVVRAGQVQGKALKVKMTLSAGKCAAAAHDRRDDRPALINSRGRGRLGCVVVVR